MSVQDGPMFEAKSDLDKQIEAVLLDAGKACQDMAIKQLSQSCMTGAFKNEIRRVLDQHGVKHTHEGDHGETKGRIAELEAENATLRRRLAMIQSVSGVDLSEADSSGMSITFGLDVKEPKGPYTNEMEATAKRLAKWLDGSGLLHDNRVPDSQVYGQRGSMHITVGDLRRFAAAFT